MFEKCITVSLLDKYIVEVNQKPINFQLSLKA